MSQFELLGTRRFLPLFLAQFLGAFNDNVFKNALVIFIAFTIADQIGGRSSVLVIFAGGIFILPFFLFSATAGQIADMLDKSRVIRFIKTAEIAIMVLGAIGFLTRQVELLLFTLFLMGTHSAFFGPLKYGILPQLLRTEELTGGNGLVQMATFLAILLGTMFGGLVIAIPGNGPLLAGVTVVLIACLGRIAAAWMPQTEPAAPTLVFDWNPLRQTWQVLRFAAETRLLLQSVLAISWFWFLGATFLSLVPDFTRTTLGGNEQVATLLLTAFSIGIGTGSLLCEGLSRGKIEPGLAPIGAFGITVFAWDLATIDLPLPQATVTAAAFLGHGVYWHVLADLVLIGLFGGLWVVPLYSMVQHRCDPNRRSRIIAANNILNALFMAVSAVIVIALVRAGITPQQVFLLAAGATGIVLVAMCVLLPEVRERSLALLHLWAGLKK